MYPLLLEGLSSTTGRFPMSCPLIPTRYESFTPKTGSSIKGMTPYLRRIYDGSGNLLFGTRLEAELAKLITWSCNTELNF